MHDKNLWSRIQRNDNQALKELFDTYYSPLCSYAVQFTKSLPEAEDIVQDAFVKLWTKRDQLHINTSLKSYLYKTVYHYFIDDMRQIEKRDLFLENLKHETLLEQMEQDDSILQKKIEKVKQLVDALPEKCREILLLSKREGYKNKEIAEKLNISIKTVESQMRIAFQKIREGFEDNELLFFMLFKAFRTS